jgi:hypothetical protein
MAVEEAKARVFLGSIGKVMLFVSGIFLLLFGMNLRSRLYYHGPDYSFFFWIFLYSAITGWGLIRLKKWAVLSLFVPCILCAFVLAPALFHMTIPDLPVLFNVAILALIVAIPVTMLRLWHVLHW